MNRITKALALYRSMVRSGEEESPKSSQMFADAMADAAAVNAQVDSMLKHINPQEWPGDLKGRLTQVSNWLAGMVSERHDLRAEFEATINRHCAENGSDTPDFLLAEYLTGCLAVFDRTLKARELWYGRKLIMESCEKPLEAPSDPCPLEKTFLSTEQDEGATDPDEEIPVVEAMDQPIRILFSGEEPNLVFVEAEDDRGKGVNVGEWRNEGEWRVLRITPRSILKALGVTLPSFESYAPRLVQEIVGQLEAIRDIQDDSVRAQTVDAVLERWRTTASAPWVPPYDPSWVRELVKMVDTLLSSLPDDNVMATRISTVLGRKNSALRAPDPEILAMRMVIRTAHRAATHGPSSCACVYCVPTKEERDGN